MPWPEEPLAAGHFWEHVAGSPGPRASHGAKGTEVFALAWVPLPI